MDRIGYFPSFQTLKTDAHFASILGPFSWSFSLIFQAVTPCSITVRKFYCQNHKKNPEAPEKIFRGSRKNFSGFHEKFWPVSRDHFACHFKRGKIGQWAKRIEGANGANGRWVWLRGLIWPSWIIIGPVAPSGPVFISLPSCRRGCISCLSLDGSPGGPEGRSIWCRLVSPL